jgi:hypothetical protein
MQTSQKSPLNTSVSRVGVPTLVFAEVRQDLYYCGLPDDIRGAYDAARYAKHDISESEYTEMYKSGSHEYRVAADVAVRAINAKAGK